MFARLIVCLRHDNVPTPVLSPPLVILWRQLVVNVADQRYPHLGGVVAAQDVADKVGLDLDLDHFEGAAQDAAQNVGVPQLVLGAPIVGQLDKVGEGEFVKDEGELFAIGGPVGDGGCGVEEDFEADLHR